MTWQDRLRSPQGQVALMAGTFAAAIAVSAGMATQTVWFEGLVRDRHPPVDAATRRLAEDLRAGRVRAIDAADREKLYALWLEEPGAPGAAVVAQLAASEAWLCERIDRTLITGTADQRRAAVALAVAAGDPACRVALEQARERVARIGPEGVLPALDAALGGGTGG